MACWQYINPAILKLADHLTESDVGPWPPYLSLNSCWSCRLMLLDVHHFSLTMV